MNSTSLAGRCGVNWNCSAAAFNRSATTGIGLRWRGRSDRFGRRIDRPLRPGIERRLGQHVIVERDGLAIAPLGVAAAPLLGDRGPIGAGLCLERGARFLIFLQLAAIFRDRLRRGRLRHRVRRRGGKQCIHRDGVRRAHQQRERDKAKTEANQLRSASSSL